MEVRDLRASAAVAGGVLIAGARGGLVLAKEGVSKMLPFLLTPIGRAAGTLAILAMAWFGFARHYENKGASRVVAKIEKGNNANVQKADAARRSVDGLPADSLFDHYRRD